MKTMRILLITFLSVVPCTLSGFWFEYEYAAGSASRRLPVQKREKSTKCLVCGLPGLPSCESGEFRKCVSAKGCLRIRAEEETLQSCEGHTNSTRNMQWRKLSFKHCKQARVDHSIFGKTYHIKECFLCIKDYCNRGNKQKLSTFLGLGVLLFKLYNCFLVK